MNINISNLTKKYGDFVAVDDISLDIQDGEILALLGVNGAGKTTTIKMLTGLTDKTSGEIFYDNLSINTDLDKIKNNINISPQETAVADNLTVRENIKFIRDIYLGKGEDEGINKIISDFGLIEVANRKARLLSGGMKRRLSIAMSLITEPRVLFLDEPTLGLDVLARSELWELISSLKSKMTIILTTHYMEEAEKLSDRVAIMNGGKIIAIDTPKNLMKSTKTKSLEDAFVKLVKGGGR